MKKKRMIIAIMIVAILLLITGITIFGIKLKNEVSSNATEISNNNSNNNIDLPQIEVILKSSNSYNEEYASFNTQELQKIMDKLSDEGGGTIHISSGTYYFKSAGMNTAKTEDYAIKCRDNITIIGDGTNDNSGTILKPYGVTSIGLDMFYFNDYSDTGNGNYLVNADFRNFIIDGADAKTQQYTTAGKGFMINILRDCDWENVKVMNTDATGFGMDCPINCTITRCVAINCGKAATTNSAGASGFGIGTGYSDQEYMHIKDCISTGNKKFGFFFEHQGRFNDQKYKASRSNGFVVSNCMASGNLYDIGGNRANDVTYENCTADTYFQFENNSRRIHLINCKANIEYSDVTDSSEYYYEPIYWALNKGITLGVSETEFAPNQQCTRMQAITFLWRMGELQGDVVYGRTPYVETGFEDVDGSDEYACAVKWAKDKEIIDGVSSNVLKPETECTRAAAITMLWRYAGRPYARGTNNYIDVEEDSWYEDAVNWGNSEGIINGMTEDTFEPNRICKRADIITMLYRYSMRENEFNITYNLNGGTSRKGNPDTYVAGEDSFDISNPMKDGYAFEGWTGSCYSSEGYIGVNNYSPIQNARVMSRDRGHKAYSANWKANSYTISFNPNSGSGSMNDQSLSYDSSRPLLENTFMKDGYVFEKWNTSPNGTGKDYNDKEIVCNLTNVDGKKITLYAQWIKIKEENRIEYTVEHYKEELNGEYRLAETQTLITQKGSKVTPEVKNYTGFRAPNKITQLISDEGTIIRYQYTRNSYKVTITKGDNIESASGDGTYRFEQNVKLYASAKRGYGNIKWSGNKNTDEFTMPANDVNINVDASKVMYKITYDLDGGYVSGNLNEYDENTPSFKLNNPTKRGYTFIGWTGSNGTVPQSDVTILMGSSGNLQYKANWKKIEEELKKEYSITITKGDNIESVSGDATYEKGQKVTLTAIPKKGYGNIEWSGDKIVNQFYMPDRNLNIAVNATPVKYKIEYVLNGGKNGNNPEEYTIETQEFKLENPSRVGYTFMGWTGSNGEEIETDVTVSTDRCENLKYIANWKVNEDEENSENLKTQLEYSKKKPTNKNVTAVISCNNKITSVPEGWTMSENGKSLFREYEENIKEEIILKDEYDNQTIEQVEINNIDRNKPKVQVDYKKYNNSVIVTLSANKEIQEVEGWKILKDRKAVQKIYEINTEENVIIRDLADNEQEQVVLINNITIDEDKYDSNSKDDSKDDEGKKDDSKDDENKKDSNESKDLSNSAIEDDTISKESQLPNTGKRCFIITGIFLIGIICIAYIRYRSLKDIK